MRSLPLVVTILVALTLAWPASAETTATHCFGGTSDPVVVRLLLVEGLELRAHYLRLSDASLWRESNGVAGLQLTDRVCYTQTYADDGTILRSTSYIQYYADFVLVP